MRALQPLIVLTVLLAPAVRAQTAPAAPRPTMDSATMVALMARATLMQQPATYVLSLREELRLSKAQVTLLTYVAEMQRDSMPVRQARMAAAMMDGLTKSGPSQTAMKWAGPIDEVAVRAEACERSKIQSEVMLNLMRDRHVVGEILTDAQIEELPMIEARAAMKLMGKAP
jgi:hypothetical protein